MNCEVKTSFFIKAQTGITEQSTHKTVLRDGSGTFSPTVRSSSVAPPSPKYLSIAPTVKVTIYLLYILFNCYEQKIMVCVNKCKSVAD